MLADLSTDGINLVDLQFVAVWKVHEMPVFIYTSEPSLVVLDREHLGYDADVAVITITGRTKMPAVGTVLLSKVVGEISVHATLVCAGNRRKDADVLMASQVDRRLVDGV